MGEHVIVIALRSEVCVEGRRANRRPTTLLLTIPEDEAPELFALLRRPST